MSEDSHTGLKINLVRLPFLYTDLPTPTQCMMHQGNSSRYVSCKKKINDGCQKIGIGL